MAHLDNLIDAVKDPSLREALKAEYEKVARARHFGLVFDRHQPESVTLPGFEVRPGEKVQVLSDDAAGDLADVDGTGVWTVMDVTGTGLAHLRDGEGVHRQEAVQRLVATREFGDPVFPGLRSTGTVVRGGDTEGDDGGRPWHTVINAENYHALEALLFVHEGQCDAIYIDPPYNTGARDWKYNNDYVDDNDPYRHSKWLSFIERRLVLAKRLLKADNSVLIVTIDEKEYARLALLLEQTFPAARITMVTASINPGGSTRSGTFARSAEYIFFVQMGDSRPAALPLGEDWNPVKTANKSILYWARLLRSGTQPYRTTHPNLFYPIYLRREGGDATFHSVGDAWYGPGWRDAAVPDGCVVVWPLRNDGQEGRWQISADALRDLIRDGFARIGVWRGADTTISYLKQGERAKVTAGLFPVVGHKPDGSVITDGSAYQPRFVPTDIWRVTGHDAGNSGSRLLSRLLPDRSFPFAKALYAVEDALRFFVSDKPDALVLDFFAGSGTTAHAVMRLNHADGGQRRSICVTNNEVGAAEQAALKARGLTPGDAEWEAAGICQHITQPRIRAAVTGVTSTGAPAEGDYRFVDEFPIAEGFAENVEFFALTYEDAALVSLGRRFEAIAPLLWLKAGAAGPRIETVSATGWSAPEGGRYGVLFDVAKWSAFVDAVSRQPTLRHVFVVTDSAVAYRQVIARLEPTVTSTQLYADYLRNFRINLR